MRLLLAIVVLASGCIEDELVHCADGRLCPAGDVCTATSCASADDLVVCSGRPDGEACQSQTTAGGACEAGACVAGECGNGRIDAVGSETCDDGNTASGDGCSAACQLEVCGDGAPGAGETCDDGNTIAGDGCSPTCGRETPTWAALGPHNGQDEREAMAAAYVPQRGAIVRFGGYDSYQQPIAGTYEYVSGHWQRVLTQHSPSARVRMTSAYDPVRQRWVMFGGFTFDQGLVAETWEFDGLDWTQRAVSGPPPSERMTMAYDPIGQRIIMHCWCSRDGTSPNTWAYNGVTWTAIASVLEPTPARWMTSLAYDPVGQRLVLFGGEGYRTPPASNYGPMGDTWELVGDQWAQVAPAGIAPTARSWHSMEWDPARQAVILEGGNLDVPDTWQLVGSTWTELTANPAFMRSREIIEAALVYDPTRGALVRYGGWRGRPHDEMFALASTGWQRIGLDAPSDRTQGAIAYDSLRDRLVMFGGNSYWYSDLDDTWVFANGVWTQLAVIAHPPPTSISGMAYDSMRDRMVVVAGDSTTWELADSTWSPVTTATTAPPPGPLVYDDDRHVMVAFSTDTMEYDGVDWRLVPVAIAPPPREGHAMTYDHARKRVVMWGGDLPGEEDGRTWEYDGTTWHMVQSLLAPINRYAPTMVYDPRRRASVLLTGESYFGPMNDTWEYDGTWRALATDDSYTVRVGSVCGVRPGGDGGIVLFGGNDYEFTLSDTWIMRWQ